VKKCKDYDVDQRKPGEILWQKKDCQSQQLNTEAAMDYNNIWRKLILYISYFTQ